MINRAKIVFSCVAMTLVLNMVAVADDVKMFSDRPPSAQEMGNILFSKQPGSGQPGVKMRSIRFSNAATEPTSVPTDPAQSGVNKVGLPIKFGYNSDQILPESRPFLDEVGKMLNLTDFSSESLVIEGHTDAKGSDRYNVKLSQKRAKAVKNYLVSKYQISTERFTVVGKGESAPLQGRDPFDAENRRVQFYKAQ